MAKYEITKANDEKLDVLYYEISRSGAVRAFCAVSVEEHSRRSVVDFYIDSDTGECEFPVADIIHLIESSVKELNEWADRVRDPSKPFRTSTLAVSPESSNFIAMISLARSSKGNVIATDTEEKLAIFELFKVNGDIYLKLRPSMYRSTLSTSYFVEQLRQAVASMQKTL